MERPQNGREIRETLPGLRGVARRSIRATGIGWFEIAGSPYWASAKMEASHDIPDYRLAGRALRPSVRTLRRGAGRAGRRAPDRRRAHPRRSEERRVGK